MNIPSALVSGALAVSSALGYYAIRSSQHQVADLRAELHALSAVVNEKRDVAPSAAMVPPGERVIYLPAGSAGAAAVPAQNTPSAEAKKSPPAPAPAPKPAEVREQFEIVFDTERRDSSWSAAAQRRAEDRLRTVLPGGSAVQSVDCRSSMCRIETRHDDIQKYREFLQGTLMNPEHQIWNAGTFSTLIADQPGKTLAVTFLARENQALHNPLPAE